MSKKCYLTIISIVLLLFLCQLFLFNVTKKQTNTDYKRPVVDTLNDTSGFSGPKHPDTIGDYLVDTSYCQIIRWPTFDWDVIPLFENMTEKSIKCQKCKTLAINRKDFNGIAIKNQLNKNLKCFAQSIKRRDKSDDMIDFTPEVELNLSETNYFKDVIAVKVKCSVDKNQEFLRPEFYEKVVPLIPELISNKTQQIDNKLPNILLLGIDSVSRLNFERHFPLAKEFITSNDFYTMYGYNKVADNTFPNLTPLLTGFYVEDIWSENSSKPLDYFPFIWKDYKNKGYTTYYLEDAYDMNTFNSGENRFSDPPTDYYLRPFFKVMESQTGDHCYLGEPQVKLCYEYLYDFIKAMNERNDKYFALHFMAGLTHNKLNNAGLIDPFVAHLLERLLSHNSLSNTVLIFFSDHGFRFGDIMKTMSGKYEERLPFMHIYVPKQMRYTSLRINQNRLTSPFDIHATLKHIINGKPDYSLKYGMSLFEEIPENRSCKSIAISDHWCGCLTSVAIKNLTSMQTISKFIVNETNRLLSQYSAKCVELSFGRTLSASEQRMSDMSSVKSQSKHYLLTIEVNPSKALFEATVNYNTNSKQMSLIGEISRINLYGNQSNCIKSAFLKKYCFCKI